MHSKRLQQGVVPIAILGVGILVLSLITITAATNNRFQSYLATSWAKTQKTWRDIGNPKARHAGKVAEQNAIADNYSSQKAALEQLQGQTGSLSDADKATLAELQRTIDSQSLLTRTQVDSLNGIIEKMNAAAAAQPQSGAGTPEEGAGASAPTSPQGALTTGGRSSLLDQNTPTLQQNIGVSGTTETLSTSQTNVTAGETSTTTVKTLEKTDEGFISSTYTYTKDPTGTVTITDVKAPPTANNAPVIPPPIIPKGVYNKPTFNLLDPSTYNPKTMPNGKYYNGVTCGSGGGGACGSGYCGGDGFCADQPAPKSPYEMPKFDLLNPSTYNPKTMANGKYYNGVTCGSGGGGVCGSGYCGGNGFCADKPISPTASAKSPYDMPAFNLLDSTTYNPKTMPNGKYYNGVTCGSGGGGVCGSGYCGDNGFCADKPAPAPASSPYDKPAFNLFDPATYNPKTLANGKYYNGVTCGSGGGGVCGSGYCGDNGFCADRPTDLVLMTRYIATHNNNVEGSGFIVKNVTNTASIAVLLDKPYDVNKSKFQEWLKSSGYSNIPSQDIVFFNNP